MTGSPIDINDAEFLSFSAKNMSMFNVCWTCPIIGCVNSDILFKSSRHPFPPLK